MERKKIDIQKVFANEGQIEGLPRNPRTMRKDKFRKLVKSIRELPEMTEARDLLVVPHGDGYVVIGGNMRLQAYRELVEPNLSLFDTTPVAYGLQLIYMKRWIARFWDECWERVYADLNVARKFYEYNKLGIPEGYNAFATRGYADREEYLKQEIDIARQLSGLDKPNMIVYGGGEMIREICLQNNVLYVEQFMTNRVKPKRKDWSDE